VNGDFITEDMRDGNLLQHFRYVTHQTQWKGGNEIQQTVSEFHFGKCVVKLTTTC